MTRSFSHLTGRLCSLTRKTNIVSTHGGAAAKPQVLKHTSNGSAICTMGAQGGRLKASLEMQVRAEAGATVMVDSVTPVKLLPGKPSGPQATSEYGIGIHASSENDALLVITPQAHVPHTDAHAGLWTRYDLSPRGSLVSVQLADLHNLATRHAHADGRYTTRTRVHLTDATEEHPLKIWDPEENPRESFRWHVTPGLNSAVDAEKATYKAADSLSHISTSCSLPSVSSCGLPFSSEPSWSCDWTYGRRFKGLVMGSESTNVVASVILAGPRALEVIGQFQGVEAVASTHHALGLQGDVHLAVQDVQLSSGELVVARIGAEFREDMHRMLHHCLSPLEKEIGAVPYERTLHAAKTAVGPHQDGRAMLYGQRSKAPAAA
jgi:hypothetical protein